MNKKFFIIILSLQLLLFHSCRFFEKPELSKEILLQKELKAINWNEVDEFPSVAECDKIEDKVQRQQCFFDFLTFAIQEKFNADTLTIPYFKVDTIEVKVTVFPDSSLQFEPLVPKNNMDYEDRKIDSMLRLKLVDFPKINPALKHGIPVKTQFILPVIIKTE